MTRILVIAAAAAALASCAGYPQRLPIGLSLCNAVARPGGFAVTATVENKSDKPITGLALALSFYHDFRYTSYTGSARLKQELDPGQKRDVTFDVSGPSGTQNGQALRCLVTHIAYMDGTSADLPPSQ
jgi:hypothetical protein